MSPRSYWPVQWKLHIDSSSSEHPSKVALAPVNLGDSVREIHDLVTDYVTHRRWISRSASQDAKRFDAGLEAPGQEPLSTARARRSGEHADLPRHGSKKGGSELPWQLSYSPRATPAMAGRPLVST